MYKIGDFSKLGQVSTRMLRHYDKLGLLTPSQTDDWTGYRYYTVDQLARLNRIIALKDLGFSLEQVAQLLDSGDELDARQLRAMLTMRRAELAREIQHNQRTMASIEARLRQIEQEGQPSPYEIVVKPLAPQPVAGIRQTVPHVEEMGYYCEALYRRLYALLHEQGVRPLQPEITLYHTEEYRETDLDVETAVAIAPRHLEELPVHDALVLRELPGCDLAAALIYEGPFEEMVPAILELLKWVGIHRHRVAGPLRELHLSGPAHADGVVQDTAVIELQLPIERAVP